MRMGNGKIRLFAAILPDDATVAALRNAARELRADCLRGNFVPPENYHVTLAFIGETAEAEKAAEAVRAVEAAPFTLTLAKVGKFSRTRGDIYWYGVRVSAALEALYAEAQTELTARGFELEKRAFRPHVTLARDVVRKSNKEIQAPEICFKVSAIALMPSDRIDGRLVYSPVEIKELH